MFKSPALRCCVFTLALSVPAVGSELCITQTGSRTELSLCGSDPFHTTEAGVADARLIAVPGSTLLLILWNEGIPPGDVFPYYALSLDGREVQRVRKTSYELKLAYAEFDPRVETPAVDSRLSTPPGNELYIVQFVTQAPLAMEVGEFAVYPLAVVAVLIGKRPSCQEDPPG